MSRQPPETALQFGRQNRVRLAADVAREAVEKVMREVQARENNSVIVIDADVPVDMSLPFTSMLDKNGDLS